MRRQLRSRAQALEDAGLTDELVSVLGASRRFLGAAAGRDEPGLVELVASAVFDVVPRGWLGTVIRDQLACSDAELIATRAVTAGIEYAPFLEEIGGELSIPLPGRSPIRLNVRLDGARWRVSVAAPGVLRRVRRRIRGPVKRIEIQVPGA